jgi:hypothetical protein
LLAEEFDGSDEDSFGFFRDDEHYPSLKNVDEKSSLITFLHTYLMMTMKTFVNEMGEQSHSLTPKLETLEERKHC